MAKNLTYTQCGDYLIPDIRLEHTGTQTLGKYGRMRRAFLEQNKPMLFNDMILSETLFPHLWEVQQTCEKRMVLLMKELLVKNPAPDKATQQLAWVAHMNYNLTPISGKSIQYGVVELALSKEEAAHIYDSFTETQPHAEHRTFEDAWQSFGGQGPLIEFVYLLTNNQTLTQRLQDQIDALLREGVSDEWLELLQLVCYAGQLGCAVNLATVKKEIHCSTMHAAIRRLKDEYLIRVVDDSTISYKNKKKIRKPKEEWVRIENTHEAIISKDVFYHVQNQIASRRRKQKDGTTKIFSGLVKCADCGWSLVYGENRQNKTPYGHYHCSNYGQGTGKCSMKQPNTKTAFVNRK